MVYACEVDGCDASYGDRKALEHHVKRVHKGYRYFCSACGHGPVAQSSGVSNHRAKHPNCRGGCALEMRPGHGLFFNGAVYRGVMPECLHQVHAEAIGEPMDEGAGGATPQELRHLGEAEAALAAQARRQQQAPPVVVTRSQALPQGVFCTMCPTDATGMYLRFPGPSALVRHITFTHVTVESDYDSAPEDDEADGTDLRDDLALSSDEGDVVMPGHNMPDLV